MTTTGFEDRARQAKSGSNDRYAMMLFDHVRLLVPQKDVRSVEPVMDLKRDKPTKYSVATVELGERRWPVFSIDRNLDFVEQVLVEHRVCVLISSRVLQFGLTCNELSTVDSREIRVVPMPACMQQPRSAVYALAILERQIACLADTDALGGRIEQAALEDIRGDVPQIKSEAVS